MPTNHDVWEINSATFASYLARITRSQSHAYFVKVGANDGLSGDPCGRLFLDNSNWSGLLIEPVPSCFEKLRANYGDTSRFKVEQVAIGKQRGKATFYFVSDEAKTALPDLPLHYDMLGSFNRKHIVAHLDGALEHYIVEVDLEVQSLAEVLARNCVNSVDLLQIDTEGYDLEVLKSFDFKVLKPRAIYIEHQHLSPTDLSALRALLKSNGYYFIDCGNDYFAQLESEHAR